MKSTLGTPDEQRQPTVSINSGDDYVYELEGRDSDYDYERVVDAEEQAGAETHHPAIDLNELVRKTIEDNPDARAVYVTYYVGDGNVDVDILAPEAPVAGLSNAAGSLVDWLNKVL